VTALGHTQPNFRGRPVASPLGAILLVASLAALALVFALDRLAGIDPLDPELGRWLPLIFGVALLGLVDDLFGDGGPRGLRGHARVATAGELSTGAIKAIGTTGLAAYVLSGLGLGALDFLVDLAVLVLAVHVSNLLDLRPGRAEKALAAVLAAVCLASWTAEPLEVLGLFLGPVAVGSWFTLRERAMLGDAGGEPDRRDGRDLTRHRAPAGRPGSRPGDPRGADDLRGSFGSISAAIERIPLMKELDSFGRVR